jgi:hypothetical protein
VETVEKKLDPLFQEHFDLFDPVDNVWKKCLVIHRVFILMTLYPLSTGVIHKIIPRLFPRNPEVIHRIF